MATPTDRRYADDGMWVRRKADGSARVGFTDRTGKVLGEIMHIDLPEVGAKLQAGEDLGVLESVTAAISYRIPLTGTVRAVNSELDGSPENINKDPYGAGWILDQTVESSAEFDALLTATAFDAAETET